jgi:hypothetical protein
LCDLAEVVGGVDEQEAEALARRALGICQATFGDDHEETRRARELLEAGGREA